MADHSLDIVSAFGSEDLDEERLHRSGPRFLKTMLTWAEQLDDRPVLPLRDAAGGNVLFDDIADRLRARGLNAAVDYGFDKGVKIPLVRGIEGQAVCLGRADR